MVISMERWKGKVAVVTGASAGIGAAIVESLVDAGMQVVGLARRKERVEEIANKLKNKSGKLHACKVDITNESDILAAFKWIQENLGPIHVLINNAGIIQKTSLIEGDTEMWRKILETNVLGLCIATREAVKNMRANNVDGHIVHINSIAGHKVPNFPGNNVYPASKFAVTALTETLRNELIAAGCKIKITSVSPGLVDTEIFNANNISIEQMGKMPILKAEDIADAVMYALATPPHVQIHELTIKPVGEMF